MCNTRKGLLIVSLLAVTALLAAPPVRAQVVVSFSVFHDSLAPHGRWVDVGSYGQCWYPDGLAAGWQPYSNGEWIYTDYGWTWVSYDPWGDYPFHYGTWVSEASFGWVWVPGYVWAPAWVTWSYSNDFVGWAPIPPTLAFGFSGYSGRPVVVSQSSYVFVPTNRMVGVNVSTVRVPLVRNATILPATRRVTSFSVKGGVVRNTALPVTRIEKAGHIKIQKANISQARTQPMAFKASPGARGGKIRVVAPASAKAAEMKGGARAETKTSARPMKSEGKGQRPIEPKGKSGSMKSESQGQKALAPKSKSESHGTKSEARPMKSETQKQKSAAPKSESRGTKSQGQSGKSESRSMKSESKPMKSQSQPQERTRVRETPPPPQHHPAPQAKPMSQPHEHAASPAPKPAPKAPEKKNEKPPR